MKWCNNVEFSREYMGKLWPHKGYMDEKGCFGITKCGKTWDVVHIPSSTHIAFINYLTEAKEFCTQLYSTIPYVIWKQQDVKSAMQQKYSNEEMDIIISSLTAIKKQYERK